jgi:hypothetical protein
MGHEVGSLETRTRLRILVAGTTVLVAAGCQSGPSEREVASDLSDALSQMNVSALDATLAPVERRTLSTGSAADYLTILNPSGLKTVTVHLRPRVRPDAVVADVTSGECSSEVAIERLGRRWYLTNILRRCSG